MKSPQKGPVKRCCVMMLSSKRGKVICWRTPWLKGGVDWENRVRLGMKNMLTTPSCWWKYLPQLFYARFTGVMIHDTSTWHLPIFYCNQSLKDISRRTMTTSVHGKAFHITGLLFPSQWDRNTDVDSWQGASNDEFWCFCHCYFCCITNLSKPLNKRLICRWPEEKH